jgi:hypothetical protein
MSDQTPPSSPAIPLLAERLSWIEFTAESRGTLMRTPVLDQMATTPEYGIVWMVLGALWFM